MLTVDLNADLGEECGDDAAMLAIVSSANIACGMHAGNLAVMSQTITAAVERGVNVGAHPSYPDRANFGRTPMPETVSSRPFRAALTAQLDAFKALYGLTYGNTEGPAGPLGYAIPYIKAHGALYNDAAVHEQVARHLVATAKSHGAAVMHQPNTWVQHYAGERGVQFIAEVFADRAYLPDGRLAPRSMEGAVLHDAEVIAERVVRMVTEQAVETVEGTVYRFADVDSICVHGDTPGAVDIARAVRAALEAAGVTIESPAPRNRY